MTSSAQSSQDDTKERLTDGEQGNLAGKEIGVRVVQTVENVNQLPIRESVRMQHTTR